MGPQRPLAELVDVALRRRRFLDLLVEGEFDKPALIRRLDVSRSTVDRAVRELETLGLITWRNSGYAATHSGALLHRAHRTFLTTASAVKRAHPLLSHLDEGVELPLEAVVGAEVYLAEPPVPYRPAEELLAYVRRAATVRSFSAAVSSRSSFERFGRLVVEDGLEFECIYIPEVTTYAREHWAESRREMIETGRYRPYQVDALPFGLFLFDDPVDAIAVLVYDDEWNLKGVLINEAAEAVAWGADIYERYRARAEPIGDLFLDE